MGLTKGRISDQPMRLLRGAAIAILTTMPMNNPATPPACTPSQKPRLAGLLTATMGVRINADNPTTAEIISSDAWIMALGGRGPQPGTRAGTKTVSMGYSAPSVTSRPPTMPVVMALRIMATRSAGRPASLQMPDPWHGQNDGPGLWPAPDRESLRVLR